MKPLVVNAEAEDSSWGANPRHCSPGWVPSSVKAQPQAALNTQGNKFPVDMQSIRRDTGERLLG